jgi:SAM-dependent MidA family methyltransferase
MQAALYGPDGFYARGEPPARHFRTSVHVSPRYAAAVLDLLRHVDAGLGHPARIDLVDVGAGRAELLGQVLAGAATEPGLARRIAAHAVEVTPRPDGLDPRIRWGAAPPETITGLVIASEWLDNVPLDVVELTAAGPVLVQVDTLTGAERPGPPPDPADMAWLRAWWPLRTRGDRAEVGHTRCEAWAGIVGRIAGGAALAADYGHHKAARPGCGTLTGYLDGRAVPALPDGSRDVTAHVALDACAAAGRRAGAAQTLLTTQREALRRLGVDGRRPSLALAASDPAAYVRELCHASENAALTAADGLGAFGWLIQTVGMGLPAPLAVKGEGEAGGPRGFRAVGSRGLPPGRRSAPPGQHWQHEGPWVKS